MLHCESKIKHDETYKIISYYNARRNGIYCL